MASVRLSNQAYDDLNAIIGYISLDLCNPQAAERFYQAVVKTLDLLKQNPCMYPLYPDEKLNAMGFRFVTVGNYLIFYLVNEHETIVTIVRIVYGKRNLSVVFEV